MENPATEPTRGFPESEFRNRLKKAQARMADNAIDVLLLTTEPDVRYFSGFHTQFWQSPTRPWYLLVPASGKPVAIIPGIGAECMGRTWVRDIRTWGSPHPDDDGVSLLAKALLEIAGPAPAIGLLMGRETHLRAPMNDFARLREKLERAKWCDATALVQGLRVIKSEAEIEKIAHIATVASNAYGAVPNLIRAGMSEVEVFRTFKIACLTQGADDVSYLVGGAGSGGYGDIISPPSARKLQSGDVLILDTGCIWDGYFCDFDRNFAIGKPDTKVAEAHRICWDATEAGLAMAKPGKTCADLFGAMNSVMAPHAIASDGDVGRLGHGLGMQLTEHPSHTSWDETVLESGMVLTLEPGYAFAKDKMMVHEENIVIRENGPQLLSKRASREIPVLD
jgi:Xaa-Pro aminopeptidase